VRGSLLCAVKIRNLSDYLHRADTLPAVPPHVGLSARVLHDPGHSTEHRKLTMKEELHSGVKLQSGANLAVAVSRFGATYCKDKHEPGSTASLAASAEARQDTASAGSWRKSKTLPKHLLRRRSSSFNDLPVSFCLANSWGLSHKSPKGFALLKHHCACVLSRNPSFVRCPCHKLWHGL